jgi:hypothetical protein
MKECLVANGTKERLAQVRDRLREVMGDRSKYGTKGVA